MEQNRPKGKNHVFIRAGKDVSGPIHIDHVGDVYAPHPLGVTYAVEKARETSLRVPSIQKVAGWTAFLSALGVLANVLGVISFFGVSGTALQPALIPIFVVLGLSAAVLRTCSSLKKGLFVRLSGDWGVREDDDQRLSFEKVGAICPICSGRVFLRSLPPGSDFRCMGMCEKNPQLHAFTFDPTTMFGSHYPIVWRTYQKS
jgi:hypothetical protein